MMILTTTGKTRILQISFVFLFLSVQSFLREVIKISFNWMTKPENINDSRFELHRYQWNSVVLSRAQIGFFMLQIIMQIPAGLWAEHYGAKRIMQCAMFYCASISLFTPFCIVMGGPSLMIIIISLQGLGQGCFIPSFYVFTSQWVPLQERSIIFSAAFGGTYFGSAIGVPIIDAVCGSQLTWIAGYIFSAIIGYLWVLASIFVMKAWRARKRISMRTRDSYDAIIKTIEISETGVNLGIPWTKILTSVPFWSTMFDHFASVWMNAVFLTDTTFFMRFYKITPTQFFLSLPYVLTLVSILLFGISAQIMIRMEISTIMRRKLFNSIALWGGSLLLFAMAMIDFSYKPARIIHLLGAMISGAEYCGVFLNHADLSPFFAGVLMGISNIVGNSAGIFKPLIQDQIICDPESLEQWQTCFLVFSTIIFFSNLPFVLYGSADDQLWTPHLEWIDDAEPTFRRPASWHYKQKDKQESRRESLPTHRPRGNKFFFSTQKSTKPTTTTANATKSAEKTAKHKTTTLGELTNQSLFSL